MFRYALVAAGRVELVTEQGEQPSVKGNWILAPDWVSPGDTYNGFAFERTVTPTPRHVTTYAFKSRMTAAERIAIRTAAQTNPAVFDFMDLADSARYIDLELPSTRSGVLSLETLGLLNEGRALQILDGPVLDSEVPLEVKLLAMQN